MGIGDKAKNKAEELAGKAKAGVGDATDNRDLEAEGTVDKAAGKAQKNYGDAKEKVKDAIDKI